MFFLRGGSLSLEVQDLLFKGAISPTIPYPSGFLSNLLLEKSG